MDYAAKAADWAAKADKRLKSFSLFGGNKYEEAAEMYEKAANQYKLAKACGWQRRAGGGWARRWRLQRPPCFPASCPLCSRIPLRSALTACLRKPPALLLALALASCTPGLPPTLLGPRRRVPTALPAGNEAGETFMKLAEVHIKLESRHDAATSWVEAAKAFLKSDQRRECLRQLELGGSQRCGGCHTPVGSLAAGRACPGCWLGRSVGSVAEGFTTLAAASTEWRFCMPLLPRLPQARCRACSRLCRSTPTWAAWAWRRGS